MSPRNIKDLLKMRHAVESLRNRKSTTGANNYEDFIQSLKISQSSANHNPVQLNNPALLAQAQAAAVAGIFIHEDDGGCSHTE
jgi:hypothetical protein